MDDKKCDDMLPIDPNSAEKLEKKLGFLAKCKKLAKDYSYVFIPIHLITSGIWFGMFYYTSKR